MEKSKTLEYMKLKGFENVRGAGYTKIEYLSVPHSVQDYISGSKEKKEMAGTLLSDLS